MKSWQTLYTDIQNLTFDTTAASLVIFKQWINDAIKKRTNDPRALVFLETSFTDITQASVQFLPLPYNFGKLIRTSVTVGSTLYSPAEAPSKMFWDRLNYIQYTSQVPYFFFIQGSQNIQKLGFYPTPSTAGNTITYYYQMKAMDLSHDDATGNNITTATTTNDVTTLTQSGTSFTSAMVGRWIQLTDFDGYWYQIATVPTTSTITLATPISRVFSSPTFSWTIGEMSVIPDGYEDMIEADVLAKHFRRIQDWDNAKGQEDYANMRFEQLINDKGSKVSSPYSSPQVDLTIPNINSFPSNLTGF